MSRITAITNAAANPDQLALINAIQKKLGMVPNFLRVFANSPAALKAFLGLHQIAEEGVLAPQTKERIALALAQQSGCAYCLSAHSAIGKKAGLSSAEIAANRAGTSEDARAAIAVGLARALAEHRGDITTAELNAARDAGYSNAEIVEIIAHVGMNLLTNILGKAGDVDIDFPEVSLDQAA